MRCTDLLTFCSDCRNRSEVEQWNQLSEDGKSAQRAAIHHRVAQSLIRSANRMQVQHNKNSPVISLPPLSPVKVRNAVGEYAIDAIVLVEYTTRYAFLPSTTKGVLLTGTATIFFPYKASAIMLRRPRFAQSLIFPSSLHLVLSFCCISLTTCRLL